MVLQTKTKETQKVPGYFQMSQKELERLKVIDRVSKRELSQTQASKLLKLSNRQVSRILSRYKQYGEAGLISKHRNKPSNHRKPSETRQAVIEYIKAKYADFGPTLVSEYLEKDDGIKVSAETVLLWMIAEGLWQPKGKKILERIHQYRERRSQFGELIQLDVSPHA